MTSVHDIYERAEGRFIRLSTVWQVAAGVAALVVFIAAGYLLLHDLWDWGIDFLAHVWNHYAYVAAGIFAALYTLRLSTKPGGLIQGLCFHSADNFHDAMDRWEARVRAGETTPEEDAAMSNAAARALSGKFLYAAVVIAAFVIASVLE